MGEEGALAERIAGLKARLAAYEEEDEPETLRTELSEAEKSYGHFLAKLGNENKEQLSLLTVNPLDAKQIQELLDPRDIIDLLSTDRRLRYESGSLSRNN